MTKRAFGKIAAGLREAIRVSELSDEDAEAIRNATPRRRAKLSTIGDK